MLPYKESAGWELDQYSMFVMLPCIETAGWELYKGRRVDYRQDGPSASTSSTSRTGRERSRSSHSTIPGNYDRRRGSPPGRRGGYRRDY